MSEGADKPFTVLVDDNFDYMDEDKRYKHGAYATMAAAALYEEYVAGGADPFIVGPGAKFSAWTYARERCEALCGGRVEDK